MKKTLNLILLSAMVLTPWAATAVKAENIEQRAPKSIMNSTLFSREQHRKQFGEQRLNLTEKQKEKAASNSQTAGREDRTCYYAN